MHYQLGWEQKVQIIYHNLPARYTPRPKCSWTTYLHSPPKLVLISWQFLLKTMAVLLLNDGQLALKQTHTWKNPWSWLLKRSLRVTLQSPLGFHFCGSQGIHMPSQVLRWAKCAGEIYTYVYTHIYGWSTMMCEKSIARYVRCKKIYDIFWQVSVYSKTSTVCSIINPTNSQHMSSSLISLDINQLKHPAICRTPHSLQYILGPA